MTMAARRRSAASLVLLALVLCVVCAWAVHAVLAPANILAYANLFMLCGGL